jgi:diguanylate cyclase (GGDEF)-like protein/PAS domain S-box-containing protein
VIGEPKLRFYAGALLETPKGLPLGTVCVLDVEPRPNGLTSKQAETLAALSRAVMSQLELRCANKVFAASERKFRILTDTMPQMVWSTLPDGSHDYYNERWYEFTGVTKGSTDGVGWKDMFHAEDQDGAAKAWEHSLATGEPYEMKYRLRHHSGDYRWTLGRAMPIRNAAGVIERWFGTCTDIHEAEVTEAALTESEARYRALVEATAMIVWRAGPDGAILDGWGWDLLTGQSPDQYRGDGWLDAVHSEDREEVVAIWGSLLAAQKAAAFEYRVRMSNGSYRWVRANAVPMMCSGGNIREWLGTVCDIHESKNSETVLRASEERYRALVKASATVGWRASPDGAIIEIAGWGDDADQNGDGMVGHQWLDAVHPDDREAVASAWQGALASECNIHNEYRISVHGEYLWVRANAVALRSSDGTIREWVGTITNINDEKTALQDLEKSEERYKALVEASATTVWRADAKGVEIATSASASDFVPADNDWRSTVHTDDLALSEAAWQQALATSSPLDVVERKLTKTGGYRWTHVRAQPLKNPDGTVREWVGAVTDIHDRIMSDKALRDSEERYRLVACATTDAIWDWDLTADTISWGASAAALLRYEPQDIGASADWWLGKIHPLDRDRIERCVRKRIAAADRRWSGEYRFQRGDGSYADVLDRGYLIRDENDRPIRMVGALQDISERQKAQKVVRESEERLRLALRAGRMVAWEKDLKTGFVSRSDNSLELLGIKSGTTSGFANRVHPEDRDKIVHFVEGSLREEALTVELRYRAPGDRQIWLGMRAEKPSPDRVIGITFDITDRKAAEEEIWRIANHDPLTGLPNRTLFQKRLEEALAKAENDGTSVSLLMIDLDDFKDVNDSLGHDAGDALLKETAVRLKAMLRDCDLVARVGGDEFAMILVAPLTLESTSRFADLVVKDLRKVFTYKGRILTTKASIGLAAFPDHHRDPAELMKDADIALYRAKAEGRNRAAVYTAAAREVTEARIHIIREVRAGLEANQFVPYYQPKVCLMTGKIVGFEALARWRHPVEGLRTPGYFGAAFADAEIAVALGEVIIRQVVSDIQSWMEQGLEFGNVAVNFSSTEFSDPLLAQHVLGILDEVGVSTNRLEVEVTETVLLGRSGETVLATLSRFHENGVRIALDDFGTGFASLSHLKQFPVDHIKIDQSFVRDLVTSRGDAAIVAAVIGLGENLGMQVTAEGVETQDQVERLRELGCDFAQGYLFAKPTAASRVPWLISSWPRIATNFGDASSAPSFAPSLSKSWPSPSCTSI